MTIISLNIILASAIWPVLVNVDACSTSKGDPIVTVEQGQLRGSVEELIDGTPYYSFKGIPYAQPPVGDLRFAAPQPPSSWDGIYNATKFGSVCPQYDLSMQDFIEGNEDCLFINVYTKSLETNAAVMVFIHGGKFMSGAGDFSLTSAYLTSTTRYGPQFLLQHDVILVTMNYRLEVLGFLSLGTAEVPGNAAMKDQVLALQWVQKNIKQFGGNPESVTLFGGSSGSASVIHHLQSPMSTGLFHKAIAQSGDSLEEWAFDTDDGLESAIRIAKLLGNSTNDTAELLEFLRSVPAIKLAKLRLDSMTDEETKRNESTSFIPIAEKSFEYVQAFITEKPINTLSKYNIINNVPLMIGYNSAEGIQFIGEQLERINLINNYPQYTVPKEITDIVTEHKAKGIGKTLINYYAGNNGFTSENASALVSWISDKAFVYNTHRFVHYYSTTQKSVYMYRFSLDTDLNRIKILSGLSAMKGAAHADDLFYLFYNTFNKQVYDRNATLQDIVYNLTKLWTDFAISGNPTPAGSSVIWPAYNNVTRDYLDINVNYTPGQFAEKERVELWDKMYCEVGLPCIAKRTSYCFFK